jgi:hypothetical protein
LILFHRKSIEAKYNEVEKALIEDFVRHHRSDDKEKMAELALILSHFRQPTRAPPRILDFEAGLRIRIHRIHMFLDLQDPDPMVRVWILIIKQNSKKNLDAFCFVTFLDFLSSKNNVNVPSKSKKQKNFFELVLFVGV